MSGGSFEYLYTKWSDDLASGEALRNLEAMAEDLAGQGYADASREAYDLLHDVRAALVRWESHLVRLEGVFKAVEFYRSADWSKETVEHAMTAYRRK